ncbi:MAG: MFS transporter [Alphaproteobacteria bacterium]|nr:MFS transporter [Alphaproteobacteria bacterium]
MDGALAGEKAPTLTWRRRIIQAATMFVVTTMSVLLLLYVSYGDGRRTYEQIHIEKMMANGAVVQTVIENYLREGLPLKQFAGFKSLAASILEGEDLDAMTVYDQRGRQVFRLVDQVIPAPIPDHGEIIKSVQRDSRIEHSPSHYQLVIPLRTRFETVGSLVIDSPTEVVARRIRQSFFPLLYVGLGLSAAFAIAVLLATPYFSRSRIPWLQVGYGVTFLAVSVGVIGTLVSLYYSGVQGKSRAAATTMSQRLHDVVAFKLQFKDIEGLGDLFSEFRRLNTEIKSVILVDKGQVVFATAGAKAGQSHVADGSYFEYHIPVTGDDKRETSLIVTVPRDIVYERVLRSVKNFAALFVASAFLAVLLLQVASALQDVARDPSKEISVTAGEAGLVIIKPVFFLAVFFDSLTYSFLPKFMNQAAIAAGFSASYGSMPFTAYYLFFALSLLPAGNLVERYGPKPIILTGLLVAGASVAAMFLPFGIHGLTVLRGLAGAGQGILMIGVQSYILLVAPPEKKTQGAAIIVFGFQGGMLSGMALGSLLVNQLQPEGVFATAGATALAAICFTILLVPHVRPMEQVSAGFKTVVRKLANDIRSVITNIEFLKVMLCIGVPAKAILTGTITFAMPLLLGHYGYRSEEIGQIVMLYGLGVIVSTGHASRLVDRTGNSEGVLFLGAVGSGFGLVLVGLLGSSYLGEGTLATVVVLVGTVVVGLAHGLINAPVVTHVAHLELASRVGANPVTTSYRFLERSGHVAGPFIVAQLFMLWGQTAGVIAGIGVATVILALFFVSRTIHPRVNTTSSETA